ncbi:hypothetical protein L9F63_011085, partial [Diploptera punctata]
CEPKQFWLISRHGTRYPSEDGITRLKTLNKIRDGVINNHEVLHNGQLCAKDLENLKKWNLQVVTSLASNLAPHGYEDLHNLALRYKARFPALLNQSYSNDLFQFKFSNSQRTTASAFSFGEGIFGPTNRVYFPEPLDPDMLLTPYKNCEKWNALWPAVAEEELKFQNGTLMASLLQNVTDRLGFNTSLSIDDINAIYDGCRFDHAWHHDEISPWCAAFTEEELQVMEYQEDLLYYYYTGYGTDMNTNMGCAPVKDFLDRFSEIEEGKQQPAGVFYFTHSEMLQQVLLPLGIAKDQENLTAANYEEMKNRQWRTSNITPFAANLAAVFFKCDIGEEYRIQFRFNEHPVNLDGCEQDLCDWSFIKQKFSNLSSSCNYNFC